MSTLFIALRCRSVFCPCFTHEVRQEQKGCFSEHITLQPAIATVAAKKQFIRGGTEIANCYSTVHQSRG